MTRRKQRQARGGGSSDQFERFVLFLAASLTIYRLVFATLVPDAWHIPDTVLLSITLVIVGYLWTAQTRAVSRLLELQVALHEAQVGVLAALVATVEAKDEYTRGHSEQVMRLSTELAKKLALTDDRVGIVSRAAALHDLGKIETPDAILHKKDRLTDSEMKVLQKHPARTAAILSSLDFLSEESRVAALHHERCDGTGYGERLKEVQIPIESSIIAVADTFDAMNSDRPYRGKQPRETILVELEEGRDIQHPGAVVDAFLELLAARPELWIRT